MGNSEMDPQFRTVHGIALAIFLLFLVTSILLDETFPVLSTITPVLMVALGAPTFIVGMILFGRYSKVFDHEETTFLGRPAKGKDVRQFLQILGAIGAFAAIIGAIIVLAGL